MKEKKKEMNPRRLKIIAAPVLAALLVISGCWNPFSPDEIGEGEEFQYHNPCDSAYKVLENLEFAYKSLDIDQYMNCFRDDFEFHLLEVDWADYTGNGVIDEYWGIDLEEAYTENMFSNVSSIELSFSGDQQSPWTGDSTGQSLQLIRGFDLKVYTNSSQTTGFMASGDALFICRPDSTGEWYIWQWWDQSNT